MVPLSWVYRALLLNEFTSDDYANGVGEKILASWGFVYDGKPFAREWIAFCFAYLACFLFICMAASAACLHHLRMEPKPRTSGSAETAKADEEETDGDGKSKNAAATFTPVNLSFKDLVYEVKASKGSETLRLLDNISGVFSSGRMCAL